DVLVSQNYANPLGFTPGLAHPTNVNYDYTITGAPLTPAQQLQNIANLLYDPAPPVFVGTNAEFRNYLDLNRNGRFDPTGNLVVTNASNQPVLDANGNPIRSFVLGDPQWIGQLEKPAFP